ncbi:hypothetical protein D9M72_464520 [compost metagenome]
MRAVDDLDVLRSFTGRAFNFLVAVVADEEDVKVVLGESDGFPVDLGDQRAGGVNGPQATVFCRLHHCGRYPVGRKDDQRTFGDLIGLINEDGALLLKRAHDVNVVNDLLTDVHGRTIVFQCLLNCNDCPVNSGAVAARSCEKHFFGSGHRGRSQHVLRRSAPAWN